MIKLCNFVASKTKWFSGHLVSYSPPSQSWSVMIWISMRLSLTIDQINIRGTLHSIGGDFEYAPRRVWLRWLRSHTPSPRHAPPRGLSYNLRRFHLDSDSILVRVMRTWQIPLTEMPEISQEKISQAKKFWLYIGVNII